MRRNDMTLEFENLAFNFFYWFSRFEFALKNNPKFRKSNRPGCKVEVSWEKYVNAYKDDYDLSCAGRTLLDLKPQRQIIGNNQNLDWGTLVHNKENDLNIVLDHLRAVRNNLFHGGKHVEGGWGDESRNVEILNTAISVLHNLPKTAPMECDYRGLR